jgi:hypothetical protein
MLKNMKRILLLLVLILLLIGCGSSKTPELDFKEKELMVNVGETFVLEPIIIEAEDTTPIEYTFDKNGIIEYISGNSFKAISTGTVEITACLKEYETEAVSIKVTVIVDKYIVKFIDNNGNVLKTEAVSYGEAATAPGAPSVEGYNFVGWDKEFNNVTSDLEVKALYEEVKVLATELELLNEFNVFKLKVGDTIKLEWKVLPSEASQQVSLVSLDSSVASVLDDGTVVAISGGNTSIIIKTIDGSNLEQTIEIYVEKTDEENP